MARVNVYVPDDLAEQARAAGLNVSKLTQDALRRELAALDTNAWLDELAKEPPSGVTHDQVIKALDEARAELGDFVDG